MLLCEIEKTTFHYPGTAGRNSTKYGAGWAPFSSTQGRTNESLDGGNMTKNKEPLPFLVRTQDKGLD